MLELKQMPQSISISQSSDPSTLIGLGKDWERLNAIGSPTVPGPYVGRKSAADPFSCERGIAWALTSLSMIPESDREVSILTARREGEIVGILPLVLNETEKSKYWTLLGSRGEFGDGKGIIGRREDQLALGESFAAYLTEQWFSGISDIRFEGIWKNDPGMRAFCERFSESTLWRCNVKERQPHRAVYRVYPGPDGIPIWPLAVRRPMRLIDKGLESGLFHFTASRSKEEIFGNALAIRSMLKQHGEPSREMWAVGLTQRFLDYRYGKGVAHSLCQAGELGSCVVRWKGSPIGGAMYWDYKGVRHAFWMEVRVHPEQEQLVFWMLLSKMIEEGNSNDIFEFHIPKKFESWADGMENMSSDTWSVRMDSTVIRSRSGGLESDHTERDSVTAG